MTSTCFKGPAFYNPQTWNHAQYYRHRINVDHPSPQTIPPADRALTFNDEEIVEPSPAGFPWSRPQILGAARQDLWQMHEAPTVPNSPTISRAGSPEVEAGEPLTPALLAGLPLMDMTTPKSHSIVVALQARPKLRG